MISRKISNKKIQDKVRLAYLSTKYPSISHTFIRRELLELLRRGHSILRLAIRRSDVENIEPLDKEESKKTIHCLSQPASRHLLSLALAIFSSPRRFCQVWLLSIKMGLLSDRGILPHIAYLLEACTLLYFIRKHRVQHIHTHFGTNSATVARMIHRLGGPSFSFTVHGPTEFDSAIGFDLQGKIADAAFVIAITDYCSAQLRRWSPPEQWEKIHVVRCTVGDDFFDSKQPIDPECNTFVCIGRLTPQKGQIILIDAFAQLLNSGFDANLVFVGDGELRHIIDQKINTKRLKNRIQITGYVPESDVRRYIVNSRALVLPSFAEGLPMVIMEAFAVGRPVISTYVAGIPELVKPGKNGWLVPAGNVNDLAASLIETLETTADRLMEMANHGRQLTFEKHRTITEGDRIEKILLRYIAHSTDNNEISNR